MVKIFPQKETLALVLLMILTFKKERVSILSKPFRDYKMKEQFLISFYRTGRNLTAALDNGITRITEKHLTNYTLSSTHTHTHTQSLMKFKLNTAIYRIVHHDNVSLIPEVQREIRIWRKKLTICLWQILKLNHFKTGRFSTTRKPGNQKCRELNPLHWKVYSQHFSSRWNTEAHKTWA